MLFSSVSFIYYFLPAFLALYFLAGRFVASVKGRNAILLLASLFFYFAGEPVYILILLFSSAVDYFHGRYIGSHMGTVGARAALVSSIIINVGLLSFFKYSDFFIQNVNGLFNGDIKPLGLALPLGISFYTFQTMSYTIDVYRGRVPSQKSFLDFAAYVTMFPQLVAGPIVRYQTVAEELERRSSSMEKFAYGAGRFIIGLSKKALIANSLGQLSQSAAGGAASGEPSVLLYWMGTVSFMLQIYFDFSGYSDMAIGLGKIMGFSFPENFRYPFTARSVTDFWRRWHITLGSWFRDYVYIPLGGSRVPAFRWAFNVLFVWFLTGFWHGAGWNFILWGLYFAVFLCLEKFVLHYFLGKWAVTDRIYTLFVLVFSFAIFDSVDLSLIPQRIGGMLGMGCSFTGNGAALLPLFNQYALYYLKSYGVLLLVSMAAATPLGAALYARLSAKACGSLGIKRALCVGEPILLGALLLLCTAYIVDSSFNPFLYFRF